VEPLPVRTEKSLTIRELVALLRILTPKGFVILALEQGLLTVRAVRFLIAKVIVVLIRISTPKEYAIRVPTLLNVRAV